MKKIILSLAVVASVLTACKTEKKEKVAVNEAVKVAVNVESLNNVDLASSMLTWKGTKPTGAHNGVVVLQSGGLLVENGTLAQGVFVVDLNTINCTDLEAGKGKEKLEGHLKHADFFDVATYPTAKFVITSVANAAGKLAVSGNLTIKDVTKSITIPATVNTANGVTTFKSDLFNVDRADFNVKYGSKKWIEGLKDKFIDDMIELSFTVVTKA